MTPDTFQTVALAWVGSAAAVIIGVLLAVVKIMPMITALSAAHELNKQRITLMTDRLNGHSAKIDTLQLLAPRAAVQVPQEVVPAATQPPQIVQAGTTQSELNQTELNQEVA